MFGDAGYVSHKLFDILFVQGLQLFTKIRRNMKNIIDNKIPKIFALFLFKLKTKTRTRRGKKNLRAEKKRIVRERKK